MAAEQGIADAQLRLAAMYGTGTGVSQDSAEAVRWVKIPAEQGDRFAQFSLGMSYHSGHGPK